ncbi:DUF6660 family protein [Dyadobacter sp. CY261]|uniref:DUF6660 family protein n=1 Tax=Dyadobacter sp. CY261 TaxID=2907203 RepID=UPI0038D51872
MNGIVAYLLAFYVLALSCIPCQDEATALPHSRIASVAEAGDGPQEAIDLCSPFCICACCASVTVSPVAAALPETPVAQLLPASGFSYLNIFPIGGSAGIWQPPQERV